MPDLYLACFTGGPFEANAYLIGDREAGEGIVVDAPQDTTEALTEAAQEAGLKIGWLVNTHGHWDHIADNAALKERLGLSIAVHAHDADWLERPDSLLWVLPFSALPSKASRLLAEGDEVTVGGFAFRVLHTPGHTKGSICLYLEPEGLLFTGDTLFAGSYGRTDLPGGSEAELGASLARLAGLPPDVRALPGHGPETTIGAEVWLHHLAQELRRSD